jgi:hypothetical protein
MSSLLMVAQDCAPSSFWYSWPSMYTAYIKVEGNGPSASCKPTPAFLFLSPAYSIPCSGAMHLRVLRTIGSY